MAVSVLGVNEGGNDSISLFLVVSAVGLVCCAENVSSYPAAQLSYQMGLRPDTSPFRSQY